ncbi:MAG: ribulokinase, partial [Tannerella sp.]|nr:ribulokinase [Tannerella sp.]
MKYVIGLDYGTDSCRAVIVEALTGKEVASSVKYYPRWAEGKYCDPKINQYRQHPLDYVETMLSSVKEALSQAPQGTAENVVGMAFDTTGSTPVMTNAEGTPLALLPEFADNPDAMFVLWKDHTAINEAAEINSLAKSWETDYTAYEGGIYSSEWVWAKVLHVLRQDEKVRGAAYSWVEHCDWMPALLTGNCKPETLLRSRCAAGHKAMWHAAWDGLPSEAFLTRLDPMLSGYRARLYSETWPSNKTAGTLTAEWAERLGLTTDVAVAVGAFDCHFGAVGAEIQPGAFVRVIGTSTCDIMVAPYDEIGEKLIPG